MKEDSVMKVVVNKCFGGYGLSDQAYEELIKMGVLVKEHIAQVINPNTDRYDKISNNEGEIIFDRTLSKDIFADIKFMGRYWDTWTNDSRDDSRLVQIVEKLGLEASGRFAQLEVVEIPDGVEWEIDEYDGFERIAEKHRTW